MFNNNIQRNLSARLGTQVPKFQNPAGPVPLTDAQILWQDFEKDAKLYLPGYDSFSEEDKKGKFNIWKEFKQKYPTAIIPWAWGNSFTPNNADWLTDPELRKAFNLPDLPQQKQPETKQFNSDPNYSAFIKASGIDITTIKDTTLLGQQFNAWKEAGSPDKWEFGAKENYDVTTKMQVNKDVQKVLSPALSSIGSAFGVSNLGDKVSNTINTFNNSIDLTGTNKALEKVNKDLNTLSITDPNYVKKRQKLEEDRKELMKTAKTNATMNLVGQGVGLAADITDEYIRDQFDYSDEASSVNGQGRKAYDAVANSLMSFSPYGTVAGGAMKVLGAVNDIAGKKTERFTADQDTINQLGGSYAGSASNITEAASKANKKFGLLDGSKVKKINKQIQEARRQQGIMQDLASEAQDQASSQTLLSQADTLSYQFQLNGGYDQRYMRAAKDGAKIQYFKEPFKVQLSDCGKFEVELSEVPTVLKQGGTLLDKLDKASTFKVVLSDVPPESFKKGGQIKDREIEVIETNTNQKSVIPEGALHKNKHHLNDVGVDDSELTKKGIPVVDNQGDQQAEIELNEIIFTLEVTKELETRYKEFYEEGTSESKKNELAEEAGKLLWKEILYNTDDRTGLIDTLKKGGVIKAQEGTEIPIVSLEDFINEKIKDRTEQAIQKATTRKVGYKFKNPNWSNCIATATDNYGVPIVIRNSDLMADPKKYGFEELQFNSIDDLPIGALIQDYNKPKNTSVPGHTIMYVGLSDPNKEGRSFPLYSYSSGKSIPEDMHNYAKYNFMRWDDKVKPRAYRYIGTPTERSQWEEEYYSLYPSKKPKHQQGGSLNQFDIDKMVKQALINILTNG